jgi:hypothetical protein
VAGAALLLSAPAFASTYVVDASGGPGADFLDIPAAVAFAQPGDVLRVLPGTYSAFTCDKGIAILGYGGPTVNGAVVLSSLPSGPPLVLAGLAPRTLSISSCDGTVIVQQVATVDTISVDFSLDVRLLDVHCTGVGQGLGTPGLEVEASRVEVVQSDLKGEPTFDLCSQHGGVGLSAFSLSRVHCVLTSSRGGNGPYCQTFGQDAADGGDGAVVDDSELILAGDGQQLIRGGQAGIAWWYQENCYYDGAAGYGIRALAAHVAHSRVRVLGLSYAYCPGAHSDTFSLTSPAYFGSEFNAVDPQHTTLALTGTPTPAHQVLLTLGGAPGSHASIWLGRRWILEPEAGVDIDLAVDRVRVVELGTVPPSGSITIPLEISATYPIGTAFGAQAECRLESGAIRRSNSVPIVVR